MPAIAFYIIRTIFLSVAVAHLLAWIHIYSTNLALFERITELSAWYLTVPNQSTALTLTQPASAFFAASFFSVTIGSCVAMLFLAILLTNTLLSRYRRYFLSLTVFGVLVIPLQSGSLAVAVYLWIVPALLLIHHYYGFPLQTDISAPHAGVTAALIAAVLFPLLISSTLDKNAFVQMRDSLLFETASGRAINKFYYRYTLFAAEAIKPLHQRNMKTIFIDDIALRESLATPILRAGYLPLPSLAEADIVIRAVGDSLILHMASNAGEQTVKRAELRSESRRTLAEFSVAFDSQQALRNLLRYSILFAVPVAACLLLAALCLLFIELILVVIGRWLPWCRQNSAVPLFASLLVYVLFLLFAVTAIRHSPISITANTMSTHLASDNWRERTAALQYADQNQMDINLYQTSPAGNPRFISSAHIAERYWYAMALSYSSASSASTDLQQLLRDEQINVVCAALNAIGTRGENNLIGPVKNLLLNSEHWYLQWYAYTALQRLGWLNHRERPILR